MTDSPADSLRPNPEALQFLLERRSRPAKLLGAPGPDAATLERILTAAARSPDHGKLTPWRFIVIEGAARERLAEALAARAEALAMDAEAVEKARREFLSGPVCVAVVASPKESPKIPEIEQTLSAGAVCAALLNASLAAGFGANWLTGWRAFDRPFLEGALGLAPQEFVAGYIHIGSAARTPPERPRPELKDIVQRLNA